MSKLTLDEAIKHCEEVAEQNETKVLRIGQQYEGTLLDREAKECRKCAAVHRQLAELLTELKNLREENKVLISECDRLIKEKGELLKKSEQVAEYKRLLKAAVAVLNDGSSIKKCEDCNASCTRNCKFKWRYTDEALALIREDGDANG